MKTEILRLKQQLAKTNERVSELEQELLHHKNVNRDIHLKNSGIATLVSELTGNSVVLPKMKTRGEIKSALNKFAIENQVKGIYLATNNVADNNDLSYLPAEVSLELCEQFAEQLRKEQE